MAEKSIVSLKPGDKITPLRLVSPEAVAQWAYASECASVGGGLMPGAELIVESVCIGPGPMWVRAQLPRREPPGYIKIPGEAMGANFKIL